MYSRESILSWWIENSLFSSGKMALGYLAEDQVFSAFSNRRGKCSVANNLSSSLHKKQNFVLNSQGGLPIKKRWAECLRSIVVDLRTWSQGGLGRIGEPSWWEASGGTLFWDENICPEDARKSLFKRKPTGRVTACIPRRSIALEPSPTDWDVCTSWKINTTWIKKLSQSTTQPLCEDRRLAVGTKASCCPAVR